MVSISTVALMEPLLRPSEDLIEPPSLQVTFDFRQVEVRPRSRVKCTLGIVKEVQAHIQ